MLRQHEADFDCLAITKGHGIEIQIWSAYRTPRPECGRRGMGRVMMQPRPDRTHVRFCGP
jgi:hypothetical protein